MSEGKVMSKDNSSKKDMLANKVPRKNMIEAIRDALDVKMAQDDNVVVFAPPILSSFPNGLLM